MIKKLLTLIIVVVIAATIAYQMGWLSRKGEKTYDKTKDAVMEKGEKFIDKAKDAVK